MSILKKENLYQDNDNFAAPVPQFILTETSSTLDDLDGAGQTPLCKNLDDRVTELKAKLGDSHPDVSFAINMIGDACNRNGDFQEALRYYAEALGVKKRSMTEDHPSIADTLCSIGAVTKQLFMLQESFSNFQAALDIYKKAEVDRSWAEGIEDGDAKTDYYLHHRTGSAFTSLGSIKFEQKDFALALDYYEKALKEAERATSFAKEMNSKVGNDLTLREAELHVADLKSNIASVYSELKQKVKAIKWYNETLSIQIRELGEDDPAVACTLHNIGTMNYRSGELILALKSYKQVLKMRRFLFGHKHPSVADALINIAIVHEAGVEEEKAESALNAALKITNMTDGEKSLKAAYIHERLGTTYAQRGMEESSIKSYSEALLLYRINGLDNRHPFIQNISKNIGQIVKETVEEEEKSSFSDVVNGFLRGISCGSITLDVNESNDNTLQVNQ